MPIVLFLSACCETDDLNDVTDDGAPWRAWINHLTRRGAVVVYPRFAPDDPMTGVATAGVILAAYYMLRMFQRVMFGPVDREANKGLTDLSGREIAILLPLVALIVWIGVYPAPFLARTEPSVERFVERVAGEGFEAPPDLVEIAPARGAESERENETRDGEETETP